MIALEGRFAYSFILGVLAAVNPCGFVLLPTYLMYFLGLEGSRPKSSQRATLRRALLVGAATSSGFIAVFLLVGSISRLFTNWIEQNAKYASLVIGIALVAMGLAMLRGWKPKISTPALSGGKDRTVFSMFLFGIAYAVASIGCTIGFLTTVIFGSISTHGFISGMMSVVLYGLGMAMLVTALTVTLAFAQGGLLQVLRNGLQYIDRIAAVFMVLTGLYLSWYWYAAIAEKKTGSVVGNVENWQGDIATFLQRQGAWKLGIIFAVVISLAFMFIKFRSEDRNSTHV